MKVLCLKPATNLEPIQDLMRARKYKVVSVAAPGDALRLISTQPFDAVVIDEELGDPQILRFTVNVHRTEPEMPIFLLSVWGSDLPAVLESIAKVKEAGRAQLLTA